MRKIMIVEDEATIARVLAAYLKKAEFEVEIASSGKEAIQRFSIFQPNVILLDIMMTGADGFDVLKYVRTISSCPVIMLTALSDTEYKLKGFSQGADDYITKPFVAEEVVARVQAILRRAKALSDDHLGLFGALKVDFQSRQLFLSNERLELTPKDTSLLLFLIEHSSQVFTREQLIDRVWGMDYEGSDRAVDLAIKRIRKSLVGWSKSEGEIKTIRGVGYQFCVY
ncbi:response regulator transcription factor [Bacillus sp. 2205SS5-2]|uniref:response regulator transcription factor n=1 Tax=Bacillus sp. 2205SS5-2 TaxID=3109031 RepID=UPI0030066148